MAEPEFVIDPLPKKKGRRPKLPTKPTKEAVAAVVNELVSDAAVAVATGKKVEAPISGHMNGTVRNHILAYLGEDIEAARADFANELLATGRQIIRRIQREVDELPHSALAFTAAVMIDKSEALRSKSGTSAKGAQVAVQINNFGPGNVDREAIIRTLHGDFSVPTAQEKVADPANGIDQPQVAGNQTEVGGHEEVVGEDAKEGAG